MLESVWKELMVRVKAELREEIRRMVWQYVKIVFCDAFDSCSFKDARPYRYDDTEKVAAQFGEAILQKTKEQVDKSVQRMVQDTVCAKMEQMNAYIRSEAFLDAIVERIQRKQL